MPSSLGPAEIVVILVVALIVLGPKRLPEAGRQVGKALSEIRKWTQDVKSEMTNAFEPDPPMAAPQAPNVTAPQAPNVTPPPQTDPSASPTDATQTPPLAADLVVRAPVEPAQPQPLAQPIEAQVVPPAPAAEVAPDEPERPASPPAL